MRVDEYQALQANAMSEESLQQMVVELARRLGWLVYHTHDSRHSPAGFPDLVMVRDGRLIFAELKSARGRETTEQKSWLAALGYVAMYSADGVDQRRNPVKVNTWRPADWFAGTIADALGGTTPA